MDKTKEEFLDEVLGIFMGEIGLTRSRVEHGYIKPAEAYTENEKTKGKVQQAILQHFQQEQEIKSLERAVEWTRHLKRGEELFGRVDWDTALYELERREKWSAGQSMTEEEPKVFTKSEVDRLIREARIDELENLPLQGLIDQCFIAFRRRLDKRFKELSKQKEGSNP